MCNELLGLIICRLIARQFQRLIEPFFSGESEHYFIHNFKAVCSQGLSQDFKSACPKQQCIKFLAVQIRLLGLFKSLYSLYLIASWLFQMLITTTFNSLSYQKGHVTLQPCLNPALANTGYIWCYISCLCDQHRISGLWIPLHRGLAAMRPACHLDTQNTVF